MKEEKENNKYDVITEDTLEKELTESEIDALRQRAKDNKFHETIEQFVAEDKFNHDHRNCMRLPDGRHRFGTIGGGISTIITMQYGKVTSIKLRCHACDTVTDITEGLPLPEDAEERAKLEKKYPHYADFDMSWVEYARYEKFCEDYKDAISNGAIVEFGIMGTGLGLLINVKCSSDNVTYDLTDTDCW